MSSHIDIEPPQILWESRYQGGLNKLRRHSSFGRILLTLIVLVELVLPSVIFLGFVIFSWQEEWQARRHLLFGTLFGGGLESSFLADQARFQAVEALIVLLIFLASKALVSVMVFSSGWADLSSFRKAVRKKRLVLVSEKDEPRLHGLASKIAMAMGIDSARLRIWLSLSPTSLPSVVETRAINLLAPMGFANMAEDDPQSSGAILAHEFAHILHRDTRLWRRLQAVSRALYHVSVPIATFLLIVAPFNLTRVPQTLAEPTVSVTVLIGVVIFLVTPILLEYAMYRWLVRSRLLSEDLADLAAAIRTTPGDLAQAIRRYVGPAHDQMHRSKQNRIERIEALTMPEDPTAMDELPRDFGTRRIVALMIAAWLSCVLVVVLLKVLGR
jgi:hypothetical protein